MEAGGLKREGRRPAERVVRHHEILSPDGDPYYGSATLEGKSFLIRERNPHKASVDFAKTEMTPKQLTDYARACGTALAHSHARTGKIDRTSRERAIDGALDTKLKSELSQFAVDKADHVTAQYKAFAATK
jgi:hypothetical protein